MRCVRPRDHHLAPCLAHEVHVELRSKPTPSALQSEASDEEGAEKKTNEESTTKSNKNKEPGVRNMPVAKKIVASTMEAIALQYSWELGCRRGM